MGEWFSSNSAAIIAASSALLAAIIAGFFGYLNILENNKSAKEQREEFNKMEKWKANRELYLKKGEEVSGLLDQWYENTHQVMLLQMFRAMGTKTREQVEEEWKEHVNKELQPKINGLLSIYFPDVIDVFSDSARTMSLGHVAYGDFLMGKLSKEEFCMKINAAMRVLDNQMQETRTKIAELTKIHL
ncbi:hypothetical protein [Serratia entomophila]|uniref:hypothetical protein n=1 Tax=Serratia entomophila TaxID=42906 RepID=UPI0021B7E539|nr:hypothetical protein [Serratia entomophila]